MKPLVLRSDIDEEIRPYLDDCNKIKDILANQGYIATLQQCYDLWSEYSDSMAAGWMSMRDLSDESIWNTVRLYIVEEE